MYRTLLRETGDRLNEQHVHRSGQEGDATGS